MAMGMYFCKSTGDSKEVMAKNHKDAAIKFVDKMLMNCYNFKLKKVSEGAAKKDPDYSVQINLVGESKIIYFQYSKLVPKNSL